jgi:hypothetical protein
MEELFSGVRLEDARVSPGADVDKERNIIRLVDLNSRLTPMELGLFQELFSLGFTVALGDREPVRSCVALCIQEQQLGNILKKCEVEKSLSPAERRRSELLSREELKGHLEAVAAYAAIAKGTELLEQKMPGTDISSAKRIEWPNLHDAHRTNELVMHYLEDNESLMSKLRDLTKDVTKRDGDTDVELYMEQLHVELGQDEESDKDRTPETEEEMAAMAIESYKFDPATGVSTFTRPKDVSDVALMRALNKHFRTHFSQLQRDAIFAGKLEWYDTLPQSYPTYCQKRDYSRSNQVTIISVVAGSHRMNRADQEDLLSKSSRVFADPRDQVLAAAIHACKYEAQDLVRVASVRGSVPGFVLDTDKDIGVVVSSCRDDYAFDHVAASGSPSPESK